MGGSDVAAPESLVTLIRKAERVARDQGVAAGYACGYDPELFIADALIAAGWQPPLVEDVKGGGL
jgi:hypothetical protein